MVSLVDIHVHLLAGLDDGPRTPEDAVAMCRLASEQGIRHAAACAHQNDEYPDNTPDRIRAAAAKLADDLAAAGVEFTTYPCAEVMVGPDLLDRAGRGEWMTVADRGKYLLIEMPHGLCVELSWMVEELCDRGLRPILGHAERSPELLHDIGAVEKLIAAGCVIQVSSKSITNPASREDAAALRDWFRRGIVHVLGTDAHSLRRRPPLIARAYEQVVRWVGPAAAERIGSRNGLAILRGEPLQLPPPEPRAKKWLSWW